MNKQTLDVGNTFGRLTIISLSASTRRKVVCNCSCGTTSKEVFGYSLVRGNTKSCGCYAREVWARTDNKVIKHGMHKTRTYKSWNSAVSRCHWVDDPSYASYGGKGIAVCAEWRADFTNFLKDMGERPLGMTLGRIDNNGDYTPANCEWQTGSQQARNRRNTRYVLAFGEKKCAADWADMFDLNLQTLYTRLRAGMHPEDALLTPVRGQKLDVLPTKWTA